MPADVVARPAAKAAKAGKPNSKTPAKPAGKTLMSFFSPTASPLSDPGQVISPPMQMKKPLADAAPASKQPAAGGIAAAFSKATPAKAKAQAKAQAKVSFAPPAQGAAAAPAAGGAAADAGSAEASASQPAAGQAKQAPGGSSTATGGSAVAAPKVLDLAALSAMSQGIYAAGRQTTTIFEDPNGGGVELVQTMLIRSKGQCTDELLACLVHGSPLPLSQLATKVEEVVRENAPVGSEPVASSDILNRIIEVADNKDYGVDEKMAVWEVKDKKKINSKYKVRVTQEAKDRTASKKQLTLIKGIKTLLGKKDFGSNDKHQQAYGKKYEDLMKLRGSAVRSGEAVAAAAAAVAAAPSPKAKSPKATKASSPKAKSMLELAPESAEEAATRVAREEAENEARAVEAAAAKVKVAAKIAAAKVLQEKERDEKAAAAVRNQKEKEQAKLKREAERAVLKQQKDAEKLLAKQQAAETRAAEKLQRDRDKAAEKLLKEEEKTAEKMRKEVRNIPNHQNNQPVAFHRPCSLSYLPWPVQEEKQKKLAEKAFAVADGKKRKSAAADTAAQKQVQKKAKVSRDGGTLPLHRRPHVLPCACAAVGPERRCGRAQTMNFWAKQGFAAAKPSPAKPAAAAAANRVAAADDASARAGFFPTFHEATGKCTYSHRCASSRHPRVRPDERTAAPAGTQ